MMARAISTYTASQFGSQLLGLLSHVMKTVIAPVRNASMRPAYVGAIEGVTLQLWLRLGRRKLSTEKPQNGLDDGRLGTGDIVGALALEHLLELGVGSLLQT